MSDQKALLHRALEAIDSLTEQLEAERAKPAEPVAVVGMSCRFPGGADTPAAYWDLLVEGRSGIVEVPPDRWDVDAFYDPDLSRPGTMYTRRGGFIGSVDGFDPQLFRISPREAETLDPQQRLLLECSWEALEDAGQAPDALTNSETGVFVGITSSDYGRLLRLGHDDSDVYSATGTALNAASGRLSFFYGLQGPCMSIDTACSSSLVAAHAACQALRAGECERAIVGGVNTMLTPEPFALFSRWGMISPEGECRTFDARANGFVRGEGCGVLVLRRLSDAERDGDRVLAVIHGSAVNQDGPSSGLSVPNGPAQVRVIRSALERAGIAPGAVDFVEAHGTATSLGDPIETEALAEAYGEGRPADRPLLLGAVKASIGHLESAAGVAGLIKLVLSVQHGSIPAVYGFETPNPRIEWDRLPLRVVEENRQWPDDRRRLGAVSSFGFSGTNAHVVVGRAPDRRAPEPVERPCHLIVISARSTAAVEEQALRLADFMGGTDGCEVADVERTLALGRARLPERAAVVGSDRATVVDRLRALSTGRVGAGVVRRSAVAAPRLAVMFSGQGAQYAGMGSRLRAAYPVFREAFDANAALLREAVGIDLEEVLRSADSCIDETAVTQPALFVVEHALYELYRSWGLRPGVVLGHSVGEFAAACAAGILTAPEALHLVAERGRLMQALPPGGGMLAVADSADVALRVAGSVSDDVALAAGNGPTDVVLSGSLEALDEVRTALEAQGVKSRALTVSHAFHSALMEPMLPGWSEALARVDFREPRIPFVSGLTGTISAEAGRSAEYWMRHVREPVAFEQSVRTLLGSGYSAFMEIGPRPVLLGMASRFAQAPDAAWIPTLRARAQEVEDVAEALGGLFSIGAEPAWEAFLQGGGRKVGLPTYPFQRKRYWAAQPPRPYAPPSGEPARSGRSGEHPVLGRRILSPLPEIQFECDVDPARVRLLAQHKVAGQVVFPAAAYIELARAAASAAGLTGPVRVSSTRLLAPLVLGDGPVVRVVLSPEGDGWRFEVSSTSSDSQAPGEWVSHAVGRVTRGAPGPTVEAEQAVRSRCAEVVDLDGYRSKIRQVGLEYGPAFNVLTEASRRVGESCGRVELPEGESDHDFGLHPGLLDAAFHLIGLAYDPEGEERFLLPVGFDSAEISGALREAAFVHCTLREQAGARVVSDVDVRTPDGSVVVAIRALETRAMSVDEFRNALPSAGGELLEVDWVPTTLVEASIPEGSWVVVGDGPEAKSVAAAFGERGLASEVCGRDTVEDLIRRVEAGRLDDVRGIVDTRPLDIHDVLDAGPSPRPSETAISPPISLTTALARAIAIGPGRPLRLVLATRGAHQVGEDDVVNPSATAVWGFAAAAAAELPHCDVVLVDLQESEGTGLIIVEAALKAAPGDRLASRSEGWHQARLRPVPTSPAGSTRYGLRIGERGDLAGLEIVPAAEGEDAALGPDDVEIEVAASGLNFRDVLNVLGMYPGEPGELGNECSGWVTRVGERVEGVSTGDLVTCIAEATFGSHVVADRAMVFPVPAQLSIAQAAAFPIAHLTAFLALHRAGGIQRGSAVLVHAGAGGVGLAAVHIAMAAGADVYATAGSESKRAFLRSLGVRRVWDSRTPLPADVVLQETDGRGVDVVLNSLTGDFIPEGIRSLAPNGCFAEIGLREVLGEEDVMQIRDDVRYVPLLLGDWCRTRPDEVRSMWSEVVSLLEQGAIPAPRTRRFPVSRVGDAFRFMARARHIGRIAVMHPAATGRARADATYVVTGGLGALGLHSARWLAGRGAKHLVLVGRSAPGEEALASVAALEGLGVEVRVVASDVSSDGGWDFIREGGLHPVRGVLHAAGVTDDGAVSRHTKERMQGVMRPKADALVGFLALDGVDPDFLVLFSSASVVLGSAGQSAYAAANGFLDGAAHRLASEGRAAVSVGWGAWRGSGMVADVDDRTLAAWASRGIETLDPDEALRLLDEALASGRSHVAGVAMRWGRFFASMDVVPPLLQELAASAGMGVAETPAAEEDLAVRARLESLSGGARRAAVREYLRDEVTSVLGFRDSGDLDDRLGFAEQGMDSLMSVELASRLGRIFGVVLPSTFVFEYPTVHALEAHLMEELGGSEPDPAKGSAEVGMEPDVLDGLTADELEAELRLELDEIGY